MKYGNYKLKLNQVRKNLSSSKAGLLYIYGFTSHKSVSLSLISGLS